MQVVISNIAIKPNFNTDPTRNATLRRLKEEELQIEKDREKGPVIESLSMLVHRGLELQFER